MLTSVEVAATTGATYRQIDYWCRTGTLTPENNGMGSGSQRRWPPREVAVVNVLVQLRRLKGPAAFMGMKTAVAQVVREAQAPGWIIVGTDRCTLVNEEDIAAATISVAGCAAAVIALPGPVTVVQPRPKKTPKKAGQSTTKNKEVATRLHSEIIRRRARNRCEWDPTGTTCDGPIECGHIIRRGASGVRTDLANGRSLCRKHHTWLDQHDGEWAAWVGIDELRRLRARADAYTRGELGTPYMFWRAERGRLTEIRNRL